MCLLIVLILVTTVSMVSESRRDVYVFLCLSMNIRVYVLLFRLDSHTLAKFVLPVCEAV